MRIKALLTLFILATAPIFLHLIEEIPTSYSQEEVLPEDAVLEPVPSPLQPAATVSAEELKNLEEGTLEIQIDTEKFALGGTIPLKYRLLGWQILGVKIVPLFAAFAAMLFLSAILTGFRETFLVKEPLVIEEKPREEEPSAQTTSGGRGDSRRNKQPSNRKRGRPPKKRPRGRPRKIAAT